MAINYRLRVDWDDDGYFNEGVPVGTPPNLVPSSPFYGSVGARVYNSSNVLQSGRIVENLLNAGLYGHREIVATLAGATERAEIGIIAPRLVRETWMNANQFNYGAAVFGGMGGSGHFGSAGSRPFGGSFTATGIAETKEEYRALDFGNVVQIMKFRTATEGASFIVYHTNGSGNPIFSFWARTLNPVGTDQYVVRYWHTVAGVLTQLSTQTITPPGSGAWTRYNVTLSGQPNSALFEMVTVERTGGSGVAVLEMTGLKLEQTALTDFCDNELRLAQHDSEFRLDRTKDYTLSFYAKGSGAADFKIRYLNSGGATEMLTSTQTVTLTASYQRIDFNLSGRTDKSNFDQLASIIVTNYTGNVTLTGFMLVEGTSVVPYHAQGANNAYDDITDYTLDGSWKTGRKSLTEYMAYEGQMDFTLNNASRIFSPNNEASPLFGNLRQNLRVQLQLQESVGTWVNIFTGWIDTWEITAGTSSDMRVTVHCNQGLFRLREGQFEAKVQDGAVFSDTVIRDMILASGYRPVLSPFGALVGSAEATNSYTLDEDAVFATLQAGIYPLSFVGEGWNNKTTVEKALKELLEAEQSHLWINRDGGIVCVNRHNYINRTADLSFSADTGSTEATYEYGNEIINRLEVFLKPKKEVSNQPVWHTKESVYVPARSSFTIKMNFEFDEGKARTITHLYDSKAQMTIVAYPINANRSVTPSITISDADLNKIDISIADDNNNNRRITFINNLGYGVYINCTVNGDYVEGGAGDSYEYEDESAILLANAVHKDEFETTMFEKPDQARAYADYVFSRQGNPKGIFKRLRITGNDPDIFIDIQQGTILSITETQTDETDLLHTIVGENGEFKPGYLSIEYELGWIDPQHYMIVGDTLSTLGDLNLLDGTKPMSLVEGEIIQPVNNTWTLPPNSSTGYTAYLSYELLEFPDLEPEIDDVLLDGCTVSADYIEIPAVMAQDGYSASRPLNVTQRGLKLRIARAAGSGVTGTFVSLFGGRDFGSTAWRGRLKMPSSEWSMLHKIYWGGGTAIPTATSMSDTIALCRSGTTPDQTATFTRQLTSLSAGFGNLDLVKGRNILASPSAGYPAADETYGVFYGGGAAAGGYIEACIGVLRRIGYKRKILTTGSTTRRFVLWVKSAPGYGSFNIGLQISDGVTTWSSAGTPRAVTETESVITIDVDGAITSTSGSPFTVYVSTPVDKSIIITGYALVLGHTTPASYASLYGVNPIIYI